ncbi:gp410 [Bacillus phage G]|uniref:Gp410 n=1 Tax=Bacillus phage G TaxID=2884420 RepID=G3MAF1_9CAUD|nr:gp410 [Bacillus phage G]AEO93668.1 gp410 [Bacillus phage G]
MEHLFEFDRKISNCPICDKKLKSLDDFYQECGNRCIFIYHDVHSIVLRINIFNTGSYSLLLHNNSHGYSNEDLILFSQQERELIEDIEEWKKNDNYLVEILKNS